MQYSWQASSAAISEQVEGLQAAPGPEQSLCKCSSDALVNQACAGAGTLLC